MRFAGFTARSILRAKLRGLRSQLVFDDTGRIRRPKNELILHFAGRRFASAPPLLDDYLDTISDEKKVGDWRVFLGVIKTTITIDHAKMKAVIEDAANRLEPATSYRTLTWV